LPFEISQGYFVTIQLLSTKLFIPPLRSEHVSRTHLVEQLNSGLNGKLTLISAPAGFGKSSLVSEWVNQNRRPTAWITLDKNDNDLRRFLAYLVASLQSINIDVEEQLPENHPTLQYIKIEDILIPLINQIANTPGEYSLVLDDYHLIQNQEDHTALAFLLENLPPTMHLVIASRADPPLPLTTLRARGQLTEIRAAQLGFSVEDGERLLNQIQALDLPKESIQTLIGRTDGWIAALQMVSIAIQGKSDISDYIQGVTGNQDYIADFLTTEVIQQQPADIQDFLLKTSLLDRLSGPLCNALTGRSDSQTILKGLRRENLFILPLDDQSEWFRYHHLFADLLRQRLSQNNAELIPALHLKASEWFESQILIIEAVDYAFRGQHIDRAAAIIEQNAAATLASSEIKSFIDWVEKLPESIILEKESLCIDYAWALLVSRDESDTAEKLIVQVDLKNDQLRGRLNVVKSMLAISQRKILESVELAQQAFDQIPESDQFYRQIAAWNLSAMLFISGDHPGGINMLKEVARLSLINQNLLVAIIALTRLGSIYMQEGDLEQAEGYFKQAIGIKSENQTRSLPASCEAILGLGKLAWERYELETAQRYITEGLELSKRWRAVADISSYVALTHLHQSLGDDESASQNIQIARDIAVQTTSMDTDDHFVASQTAHLSIRQGDLKAVEMWAAERGLQAAAKTKDFNETQISGTEIVLFYELIVFARYLLANKRDSEALTLLDKLLPALKKLGHRVKELEIQILQTLGLGSQGKIDQALDILGKLLNDPKSAGFKRVFMDEGPPLVKLIKIALDQGLESKLGQEIIDFRADQTERSSQSKDLLGRTDPLSKRELEVLQRLLSELTVPEIAEELHIAVSTLRTHIKNIYSKLAVHSRFEATTKARDLDLI
jgi:LuxR family maltose regulon positive regulatory protein